MQEKKLQRQRMRREGFYFETLINFKLFGDSGDNLAVTIQTIRNSLKCKRKEAENAATIVVAWAGFHIRVGR